LGVAPGSFDKEWQAIEAAARKASITIERELVQGWLEPWLSGKDTLALIQSAMDSGDGYFIATQALGRKTLLIQRSSSVASEIAAHWTRRGVVVYALVGSAEERKSILSRFGTARMGTLVVPFQAFDDDALAPDIQQLKINGLVAEEAQRVSELSFDFDIAYDRIPNIITRLGRPPTLAVLRSAPPSVRTDLPHRLGLRNAQRVDLQPLPETIGLEVPVVDIPHRGGTLIERVGQSTHPITVLCSAAEEVDEILEVFGRAAIPARASFALGTTIGSHAMPPTNGDSQVITVGVSGMFSSRDPSPRTLIHYHAPSSLEQYSRDLGRLDIASGKTSAIVLAALEDETPIRQWLDRQRPRPEDLMQVATVLNQHAGPGKMALVDTLSASLGLGRARVESLLSLLASAGWIEHKLDWVRVPEACTDLLDRARSLAARLRSLRERDHQRMRSVSAYVIGRNCRHESMRRHFGTAAQRPCGVCDNCRTKAAHAAANGNASPAEPGSEPSSPAVSWVDSQLDSQSE
jgi:ATP-dependent DNA helicase RecQ